MQAAAENVVDAIVAKTFENLAGEALGFIGIGTGSGIADLRAGRLASRS